jgi:AraC-like DNA-binding protein
MPFFRASADLHPLAVANVAYWFQFVGVGVSVYSNTGTDPICGSPDIIGFELEHGKEHERYVHNSRSLLKVRREGRSVLAEHAGFWDLFVPVGRGPTLRAIFMTGPFSRSSPDAVAIRERWLRLTGRPPTASDPEFSRYVETTFSTPVLDARRLSLFERLLDSFGLLLESHGDAAALRDEVRRLQVELADATRIDKMWEIAASMIGGPTARSWSSQQRTAELRALGVRRVPTQLVVALATARTKAGGDPIDEIVRRHGFLRACTDLGRRADDLVCGRLGDRGVVLLVSGSGNAARRRRQLVDLAESAITLAGRRFGFGLHVGIGPFESRAPLNFQFAQALGASELALARGLPFVHADPKASRGSAPLSDIRRELAKGAESDPLGLLARFDRYAEAAAVHCGYLLETVRAHLEAGFERVYDALVRAGALEAKGTTDMMAALDASAGESRTVAELVAAFRTAVAQLADATARPREARRDRSLRRAVAYILENYADENLSLARAARVAGFAPGHFSELFGRDQGVTFTRFVHGLRMDQAKRLLMNSDLAVERVAQLSGFPERHYFNRAFRKATGTTPQRYRKRFLQPSPGHVEP